MLIVAGLLGTIKRHYEGYEQGWVLVEPLAGMGKCFE